MDGPLAEFISWACQYCVTTDKGRSKLNMYLIELKRTIK